MRFHVYAGSVALALGASAAQASPVSFTRTVAVEYRQGTNIIIDQEIVGAPVGYTATGAPLPAPDATDLIVTPSLADLLNTDRPPSGGAQIQASILQNDFTYLSVDASLNNSIAQGAQVISASVSQTILGGNPFSTALDLAFAFDLKEMSFELVDQWGAPIEGNPYDGPSGSIGTRLSYEVSRDGWTYFRMVTDIWGGRDGITGDYFSGIDGLSTTGAAISSALFPDFLNPTRDPVTRRPVGASFLDRSVTDLNVGRVSSGDTYEITAVMTASVILPEGALGAGARLTIGDPNALTGARMGTVSFTPAGPAPIPLPSALWLLGGALGALAGTRRTRGTVRH